MTLCLPFLQNPYRYQPQSHSFSSMAVSDNKFRMGIQPEDITLPEKHIGTQGLKKQILRKGVSWQSPSPGDEVQVHYSLHLEDGEYFDTSRDKETPFTFKLGQYEVIRGWDEGISTMKKGERAIFVIPPNLAYGDIGCPPFIPPNSTLVFDVELVSWNTIKDITGDGGILKKTTEEGEGWATPKDADEVLVKYIARLENGAVISKSDDGIEFNVANGYICPAMSRAVKTMRKGEKAELSVKFIYGLEQWKVEGAKSVDIPSNSSLIIDIELVSWKSVIDVTGDKRVLKKIIKTGEGFDRPNEGSLIKVIYTAKLDDGTIFERKGSDEEPFNYLCFEEQISDDLDRAIMTMRKGEEAIVSINSNILSGYEVAGLLSADSVLVYEVKLIDFVKDKPFWKMGTQEKLQACERKKDDGNRLFKAGKFRRASMKYEKASKYIEFDHSFNDEEKCQANVLRVSCYLNNAACKLKLEEYLEASRLCTKVLENDPGNVKALYRRSQAYLKISELEKAETDIKHALSIDPSNRDLKLVNKELKEKQKQYFHYEAETFSNMLSWMC